MQAFLVVALAVVAVSAESDPNLLINPYYQAGAVGSPFYSSLTYGLPTVARPAAVQYSQVVAEQKSNMAQEVPAMEEEKKFEVPVMTYKTPVVGAVASPVAYTAGFPYTAGVNTYAAGINAYSAGIPYAHMNAYTTGVIGTQKHIVPATYHSEAAGEVKHTVFKREAEADPALLYTNAFSTTGFPYASNVAAISPYASNVAAISPYASNFAAFSPYVSRAAAFSPYYNQAAYTTVPLASSVKTYANDAVKPQNYAAKGQYVAQSAGAIHIAKRDAEADPAIVYSSVTGYPYASSVYGNAYNAYNTIPQVYSGAYNTIPQVYSGAYNTIPSAYRAYNTLGYNYLY